MPQVHVERRTDARALDRREARLALDVAHRQRTLKFAQAKGALLNALRSAGVSSRTSS